MRRKGKVMSRDDFEIYSAVDTWQIMDALSADLETVNEHNEHSELVSLYRLGYRQALSDVCRELNKLVRGSVLKENIEWEKF